MLNITHYHRNANRKQPTFEVLLWEEVIRGGSSKGDWEEGFMRSRGWKDRRGKLYNEVSDPVNRKQNEDLELTTELNNVEEVLQNFPCIIF